MACTKNTELRNIPEIMKGVSRFTEHAQGLSSMIQGMYERTLEYDIKEEKTDN